MSTITYDAVPNARAVITAKIPAGKRKGLFARLIEARQQQANAALAAYRSQGLMRERSFVLDGWVTPVMVALSV